MRSRKNSAGIVDRCEVDGKEEEEKVEGRLHWIEAVQGANASTCIDGIGATPLRRITKTSGQ